jgi:hypothetical protein
MGTSSFNRGGGGPKIFGNYWPRNKALTFYSVRRMAVLTEGFLGFPHECWDSASIRT